jgi:hypothetical protein
MRLVPSGWRTFGSVQGTTNPLDYGGKGVAPSTEDRLKIAGGPKGILRPRGAAFQRAGEACEADSHLVFGPLCPDLRGYFVGDDAEDDPLS